MPGTQDVTDIEREKPLQLEKGQVIAERYSVVRLFRSGPERSIYICRRLDSPDQTVAVKLFSPTDKGSDVKAAVERLKREVLLSYTITHPNVLCLLELIEEENLYGYTMEFTDGGDLRDQLHGGATVPIDHCVFLLKQICSGVQAIHDGGIIHRNLKPDHILLTKEGRVKISDFGAAQVKRLQGSRTEEGVKGTINYLSPECILDGLVDRRTDVYSIGVIAYEMLTGSTPFESDNMIETLSKRAQFDPPAVDTINSECPSKLNRIILKALARSPENRYSSAEKMFNDLDNFVWVQEKKTSYAPCEQIIFQENEKTEDIPLNGSSILDRPLLPQIEKGQVAEAGNASTLSANTTIPHIERGDLARTVEEQMISLPVCKEMPLGTAQGSFLGRKYRGFSPRAASVIQVLAFLVLGAIMVLGFLNS